MPLPPGFIAPCLPTKAPHPPTGALRVHEIKHEEYPTTDELAAIAHGRVQFERGDYVTLEQWEHDMGSRAR
jgi:hypothetical protein